MNTQLMQELVGKIIEERKEKSQHKPNRKEAAGVVEIATHIIIVTGWIVLVVGALDLALIYSTTKIVIKMFKKACELYANEEKKQKSESNENSDK